MNHVHIVWHESVPGHEIVMKIRTFDAQLVWFPPVSENMHLCLGNKFFEAIQGHLALISGPSPSMAPLIEKYGSSVRWLEYQRFGFQPRFLR
jgi:hypothetical protein